MSSCWRRKAPNPLVNIYESLFVAVSTFPHRYHWTFIPMLLAVREYWWNHTQPNKSQVGCKQSVRGLIYYKQPAEGWCYQGVPCDHQGTCAPAAGVTQHLDLPSSSLLSLCVCVCVLHVRHTTTQPHTHTHTHTHRGCPVPVVPLVLIQMVLLISHSAADGAP